MLSKNVNEWKKGMQLTRLLVRNAENPTELVLMNGVKADELWFGDRDNFLWRRIRRWCTKTFNLLHHHVKKGIGSEVRISRQLPWRTEN